jgi:hypothetical protein
MDSKTFAEQFLLLEVEKMKAVDVRLQLLAAIIHGIETSGALLDSLPFKAKGQGKKRFDLALTKLFPADYLVVNNQLNLYSQLRSHMTHCMLPAKTIHFKMNNPELHLKHVDGLLYISLEALYNDYRCAVLKLVEKLEAKELKNKRIVFENLGGLYT